MNKPQKTLAELMNMSFGFFGIQIGFALQNANMSRIFQSLGESLDNLPALWIAAPLTGLLVQPIIGHFSDKTWGKLGRRRPYFLAGAILATIALFVMPLAPALWFAAMMLWMLDASLNISMEPFRAFVGDMLDKNQHTKGYAIQTAFIGAGAVVGSMFPYLLSHLGVSNEAVNGTIPDSVKFSFWFGAIAIFLAVLWTVITTKEYSPEEMESFKSDETHYEAPKLNQNYMAYSPFALAGVAVIIAVLKFNLEKEVLLLGGLLITYAILGMIAIFFEKSGKSNPLSQIVGDFSGMPSIMKKLALVQFFSWSALFIMWIYTTPVVAQNVFGTVDTTTKAFNDAGNWVGILFSVYNGVAALAALFLLPKLSDKFGKVKTHMICLLFGALGYLSFFFIKDQNLLIVSEIGVGIAWASILAMPYAILASSLPQQKLGIYMGLFNVFIVVPQLLVATVMGTILKHFFPHDPIYTMGFAAGVMFLAAISMLRIKEEV